MRRIALVLLAFVALGGWPTAGQESPRLAAGQVTRFAVIGDSGTGESPQYETARQLLMSHAAWPFDYVLMMGDNLYGSQQPRDFVDKFEIPYGPLLRMGIPFYAALGNHDQPTNRDYTPFHMGGQRYYTFVKGPVRYFVLDTNFLDHKQVEWFERELRQAVEEWRIVYFHHPLYSDGDRHGPNVAMRVILEPLLVRYGVNVVLSGHEHVYERLTPQQAITYFIVGSSGQLRRGGLTRSAMTAASFDQDQVFLLGAINGDEMTFKAISRIGRVVDSGAIRRRARP